MKSIITGVKLAKYVFEEDGKPKNVSTHEVSFVRGVPETHDNLDVREIGLLAGSMTCSNVMFAEELYENLVRSGGAFVVADLDFDTKGKGEKTKKVIRGGEYLGSYEDFEHTNDGLRDTRPPKLAKDDLLMAFGLLSSEEREAVLSRLVAKDVGTARTAVTTSSPVSVQPTPVVSPRRVPAAVGAVAVIVCVFLSMFVSSASASPVVGVPDSFNVNVPGWQPVTLSPVLVTNESNFGALGHYAWTSEAAYGSGDPSVLQVGEVVVVYLPQDGGRIVLATSPGSNYGDSEFVMLLTASAWSSFSSATYLGGHLEGIPDEEVLAGLTSSSIPEPSGVVALSTCGVMLLRRRGERKAAV